MSVIWAISLQWYAVFSQAFFGKTVGIVWAPTKRMTEDSPLSVRQSTLPRRPSTYHLSQYFASNHWTFLHWHTFTGICPQECQFENPAVLIISPTLLVTQTLSCSCSKYIYHPPWFESVHLLLKSPRTNELASFSWLFFGVISKVT
jgi:hypothetical protein